MKKITAFFALIMPIFVAAILFICGLATKGGTHKPISSVEIVQNDFEFRNETNEDKKGPQLDAVVYPLNAYNTEVYWTSSNPEKISIDDEGNITAKANAYGTTTITATSKADKTKFDTCNIFVWDDKIHDIDVSNAYNVGYIGLNESKKIEVDTIPSDRIKNKALTYEVIEGSEIINCNSDGLIIPKKEGSAKVKISAVADPTKTKTIDVEVGKGVNEISTKEKSESLISSQFYSMFDDLVIAPETDHSKLKASDFEYTTDNPDVATFITTNDGETGIASFIHEGTATFHATYKRNKDLTVSKTVTSTCEYLKEVSWNQQEIQIELETSQDGESFIPQTITNLECITYPKASSGFESLEIESSNKDVVEINNNGQYIAKQPGVATLLASIGTGYNQYKYDACVVNVLPKNKAKIIRNNDIHLKDGMFYFPLRKALSIPTNKNYPYEVEFEVETTQPQGCAKLDDKHSEFINFKEAGYAIVKVYLDGKDTGSTITVTAADDIAKEIVVDDSKTTYNIKVGQRYTFNNGYKPVWDSKSYSSNFNYKDSTGTVIFSAISGQSIEEFEISNGQGKTKTIKLIVEEDPLYIKSDINDFTHTSEIEIDFKDYSNCIVVPSTATSSDGQPYSLAFEYTPATDDIATIEGDKITYKQSGLVEAKVSCGNLYEVFKIKSSYGTMTNFDVYDSESQKVKSNTNVTLAHGDSLVYTISGLSSSEASQIEAASLAENSMLDITVEKHGLLTKTLTITITAKNDTYGKETIAIRTKTQSFNIYLNITVASEIEDIQVYWRTNLLASEGNISYRDNLILDVLPYPAVSTGVNYTSTFDSKEIDHTNNKINLTNITAGDHTLEFVYQNNGEEITKTFKFTKKDNYQDISVSIADAELEDSKLNIYVACNYRSKSYYLKTNGFVDDDFWTSQASKFTATLEKATAEVKLSANCITIENMPEDDGSAYTNTLSLKYNDVELNKYYLTRDIVSNIIFPKHDNNAQSDKKGLQKVHVYGKYSYDTAKEGLLDYYKMPIVMYDYNHKEIKDPSKCSEYFKTLKVNINKNGSFEYLSEEGMIKITFSDSSLYTAKEINDNVFDAKSNSKNVVLQASTKSKHANANYTFVVVDGVNTTTQDGLLYANDYKLQDRHPMVLQTNFGLEGVTKDNIPITDSSFGNCMGIYGNGYTINLNTRYLNAKENQITFHSPFVLNVNFQGCYSKNLALNRMHRLHIGSLLDFRPAGSFLALSYSTITNWTQGINVNEPNNPIYIKNTLFYSNSWSSIVANIDNVNCYIEDSIFFDSASLPINAIKKVNFYFKGNVGIYNFKDEQILKNIFGVDVSFMWPVVLKAAKNAHMVQTNAQGKECINSFMLSALTNGFYFWDNNKKEYIKQDQGTSSTLPYLAKYIDISLPWPLSGINAGLWGLYTKDYMGGAPDYYDEYNPDGTLRIDFLNKQIDKVTRRPNYF